MPINYSNVELAVTAGLRDQFPRDNIVQIALSGRSNVGKSSFINRVCQRKNLARVSGSPGKTITLNFYLIDHSFYLVDLPGYGFAKRPPEDKRRWSELTNSYFVMGAATAVIQFVDLKVGATADDELMLDFLGANRIPFIVVATKADKLNKTERGSALESLQNNRLVGSAPIIAFSAQNGEGLGECRREILSLAGGI